MDEEADDMAIEEEDFDDEMEDSKMTPPKPIIEADEDEDEDEDEDFSEFDEEDENDDDDDEFANYNDDE